MPGRAPRPDHGRADHLQRRRRARARRGARRRVGSDDVRVRQPLAHEEGDQRHRRRPDRALRGRRDRAGARRLQGARVPLRDPGRDHDRQERRHLASFEGSDPRALRAERLEHPLRVRGGLHHGRRAQGAGDPALERGDRRGRPGDAGQPPRAEPHLHDGQLRRPRLVQADPPAGRHARPDGQSEGRDHRASDQGQLHGRPDRARVLHLDPRRPKGSRGHGAPYRRLRVSHPSSRRRRPGRDRPGRGLQDEGLHRDAGPDGRRFAEHEPAGSFRRQEARDQARPRASQAQSGDRQGRARRARRGVRGRRGRDGSRPLDAQVRARLGRVPALLRPRRSRPAAWSRWATRWESSPPSRSASRAPS